MTGRVKRKRVQSTEFDQPYSLRKKRKTEAKTIQELYNPTPIDSGLGESDNQQIFKSNIKDLTQFFLDQECNPASHGLLSKTGEYDDDQVIYTDSLLPENSFLRNLTLLAGMNLSPTDSGLDESCIITPLKHPGGCDSDNGFADGNTDTLY